MSEISTILLGAQQFYDQPVLFQPAGAWVSAALQEAGIAADAAQADAVVLVGAPCPELTAADYRRLADTHLAIGADVTVFADPEHRPARGAQDEIVSLPDGILPVVCATPAAARTLTQADSLIAGVNALLAAGGSAQSVQLEQGVTPVTDGLSAYAAQKQLCMRINLGHIARGVQIFAPESVYIAPDVLIGAGTTILPGTIIRGGCTIGASAVIGPNALLERASIGDGTTVNASQVYESTVGAQATVGPFAYIRPGCRVGDKARIGDFVELKKAEIGSGTKVSHLTYIGDATVGERVNFGCGTVVVNYDGYHKYHTHIGDDCFIGCNTNLVAPVRLGDRVFTAAGTTVTKDVPDGALAVARARQTTIEGWNDRRRARMDKA